MNQKLESKKYEAFLIEPKIFYIHFFTDIEGNIDDVTEIMKFQHSLNIDRSYTRILHAEKFVSVTKEAREYVEKNAPEVTAEAYVIPSLAQKILFNLYIKFRRNSHPIKGFETLDQALTWVKSKQKIPA